MISSARLLSSISLALAMAVPVAGLAQTSSTAGAASAPRNLRFSYEITQNERPVADGELTFSSADPRGGSVESLIFQSFVKSARCDSTRGELILEPGRLELGHKIQISQGAAPDDFHFTASIVELISLKPHQSGYCGSTRDQTSITIELPELSQFSLVRLLTLAEGASLTFGDSLSPGLASYVLTVKRAP